MFVPSSDVEGYYPPSESKGGWRWIEGSSQVKELAGMVSEKLDLPLRNREINKYGSCN